MILHSLLIYNMEYILYVYTHTPFYYVNMNLNLINYSLLRLESHQRLESILYSFCMSFSTSSSRQEVRFPLDQSCVDGTEARTPPSAFRDAAHHCASRRSWSDRRAHLDGTQSFEGQRRSEDQPVRLSEEPHTAENHARNESLRGRQDLRAAVDRPGHFYILIYTFPSYRPFHNSAIISNPTAF